MIKQIEGQMSLFDIVEAQEINTKTTIDDIAKRDFNTMTIQRAAELIEKETGIKFKSDNRHFKDCYSAKHNGYEIDIFFSHYAQGIRDERRFLDLSISKGTSSSGNPCESIKEAIRTINKRIFECQYSGHNCNKEELWKIAESLDDPFCPHVCCRNCATKGCGARCNGSEEPKDKVKCQKSEECEAYPTGCGGSIEPCRFGGPFKWSAKEVIVKGYMDDGYCPNCDGCLDDLVEECTYCKQKVTWENWKRINKK